MHYDPGVAEPFKHQMPEGDLELWPLYDAIRCPVLVLRGELSDLLRRDTCDAMAQRGPKARVVEIAGVGHAPQIFVRQVPGMVRQGATAGVGQDDRAPAGPHRLSQRPIARVAEVDQHALVVHCFDHGLSQGRESGVFVGQATAAHRIHTVVGQLHHPHALRRTMRHPQGVGPQHLGVLKAQHHAHLACGPAVPQIGHASHLAPGAVRPVQKLPPSGQIVAGLLPGIPGPRHMPHGDADRRQTRCPGIGLGPRIDPGRPLGRQLRPITPTRGLQRQIGVGQAALQVDPGARRPPQRAQPIHTSPRPTSAGRAWM